MRGRSKTLFLNLVLLVLLCLTPQSFAGDAASQPSQAGWLYATKTAPGPASVLPGNLLEQFPGADIGSTLRADERSEPQCPWERCNIEDGTLVQRWENGVPSPGGTPPQGWFDIIGDDVFDTHRIQVIWSGEDIYLEIWTNFPQEGYRDGTPFGYPPPGGFLRPADLAFDLDNDGKWETGLALFDHGAIPYDPANTPERQPPGQQLSADQFTSGYLYAVSAWFTADDIHRFHMGIGALYDLNDPKPSITWMRYGTPIKDVALSWVATGTPSPAWKITIVLEGINTGGQWDIFNLLWNTANCANDSILGYHVARKPLVSPGQEDTQQPTINDNPIRAVPATGHGGRF